MSILAVSVQYYGHPAVISTLKAGAFWPRPNVDSAILGINIPDQPPLNPAEEKRFFTLVKVGFSQKRKQLQKNLRQLGFSRQKINTALEGAGVDGRRRAETLTLQEWIALLYQLQNDRD
jgi:16S rRNA (adenine1518-N6/adenine1519-N6)-dimethyltransferase